MKKWIARFVLVALYLGLFWIEPLFFEKYTYWIRVGIAHGAGILLLLFMAIVVWAAVNSK